MVLLNMSYVVLCIPMWSTYLKKKHFWFVNTKELQKVNCFNTIENTLTTKKKKYCKYKSFAKK